MKCIRYISLRFASAGLLFFTFLVIWEIASQSSVHLQFALPAPSGILTCMWDCRSRLIFHSVITIREMLGGFFLALFCAFPLAWMMSQWKTMRMMLQPIFVMIQCIPMFALAPLMVLWFDWSFLAVMVPTALMIFFPLTMNIYKGLCATPNHLLDFFQINKASSFQTFWKLKLPWAVPYIWAGFRISSAIAGVGAVAGEWAGAQNGLGVLMIESRRAADIEMMFAALASLTIITLTLYSFVLIFENRGKLIRVVPFLLVFSLLSGCGPSEKKTRLVLDWLPNPNHIPLYVGLEKGFFEEEGIDLVIKKIHDPGDPIPLLTSGQADLAVFYSAHTLRFINQGAPIKPIGILIEQPLNAVIYRKDRGIQQISDLNGKAIGYCLDGTQTKLLSTLLSDNQVEPSVLRNIQFDLVGSLATGRIDAVYGGYWNIECQQFGLLGIDVGYFSMADFGVPSVYELLVLAREGSSESKEPFSLTFQKALQRSIDYCLENPEEAFQIYLLVNPDKREKTVQWERAAWQDTLVAFPRSQLINFPLWNQYRLWLLGNDLL